jgi:hypothetical protein
LFALRRQAQNSRQVSVKIKRKSLFERRDHDPLHKAAQNLGCLERVS